MEAAAAIEEAFTKFLRLMDIAEKLADDILPAKLKRGT